MPGRYTDANPFRIVTIDPDRLTRSVLESAPKWPQWGRVEGGDWDRQWDPFNERAVPRGIRQHFVEGVPWRETALFEAYCEQLERFGNAWGHRSIDEFETRCRAIERLYESIRTRGYTRRSAAVATGTRESIATRTNEINVDIARDGALYWRGYGQHRLAIAKLLELDSVPVLLHRRHGAWQRRRDRLRERSSEQRRPAEETTHPDLEDLLAPSEGASR